MIEGFCWPLSAAPGETIAFRDGEPLPVAVWQVLNSQLVTELADNLTLRALSRLPTKLHGGSVCQ
jgi:hypothetical protein